MRTTLSRFPMVLILTSLLILTPLSFSTADGITETRACASDGSCAKEVGSICTLLNGTIMYDRYNTIE